MHGFAFHDLWLFARYARKHPANKQPSSSGGLFCFPFFLSPSPALALSYWCTPLDRSFWDRGQRFLREYERATSCNQAVSVTTQVQGNGKLPLKIPPDHSLEVEIPDELRMCVCACVCGCLLPGKRLVSCCRHSPGHTTSHKIKTRRQLKLS